MIGVAPLMEAGGLDERELTMFEGVVLQAGSELERKWAPWHLKSKPPA